MKLILTALISGSLVAATFGLAEMSSKPETPTVSSSATALSFSSDDGQATATLICESLFEGQAQGDSPRSYKLFGAYIDSKLGMVGSSLQTFGSYQTLGAQGVLPGEFALEMGDVKFTVMPITGDWSQVQGEADVLADFLPLPKD